MGATGFVLALIAANIGFLFCYNGVTSWEIFKVEAVEISGTQRLSEAAVREQAGIEEGENLLAVNLVRSRRLLLAHPWIEEAELYREIPNRIRMKIKEHECLAVIDLGRRFLIDPEGDIFSEDSERGEPDIPLVTGLDYADLDLGDGSASPAYRAVLKMLTLGRQNESPLSNRQFREIRVDRDTGLTLTFRSGADGPPPFEEVFLGYGDYADKLKRLSALPQRLRRLGQPTACRWVSLDDSARTIIHPAGAKSS